MQRSGDEENREPSASAALAIELSRLRAVHEALQGRVLELEAELEVRTRRLHQLIGERDQLAALMRGRDETIQQLNRELGARQAPSHRPASGGALQRLRSTFHQMSRMPTGILRQNAEASPGSSAVEAPAEPPLIPWVEAGPPRPILCAVITGLPRTEIEGVLEMVERQCRQRRMTPMLLTSEDAFEVLRGRRLVVEVLPPLAALQAMVPDRPAELYLQRRLALIRRKWQPQRIVAFGPAAAELVQLWHESPFEGAPLPTPAAPSLASPSG